MRPCIDLGPSLRDIALVAGAPPMWNFLRSCLQECVNEHSVCARQQENNWFPKRLLSVAHSEQGACQMRLIETCEEAPRTGYVAFSHCWGGRSDLCAIKTNINVLKKSVDEAELPRAYQDCVTAARELDVEYIWIDALCILQDDKSDWACQSQEMDKVYQNALITVAASVSRDSSVPFLGPQAPSLRKERQPINISLGSSSIPIKARENNILRWGDEDKIFECLDLRAWAWQERLFSCRYVSFLAQKVSWKCKTTFGSEDGIVKMYTPSPLELLTDESAIVSVQDWYDVVAKYSTRQFTYWTDRLPALAGTASRFQRNYKSTYLAGLWAHDFPRCLAWQRRELHDTPSARGDLFHSPNNSVPSWSWASIVDRVHWAYFSDTDWKPDQMEA